jgi:hypothetical protein
MALAKRIIERMTKPGACRRRTASVAQVAKCSCVNGIAPFAVGPVRDLSGKISRLRLEMTGVERLSLEIRINKLAGQIRAPQFL